MTIDGVRIDPSLVAMVCASEEGEPELLVLDGYDGTGDVIHRVPLPMIGNYVDLDTCSKIVQELGYQSVVVVHEGLPEPPDVWTGAVIRSANPVNGWVATAVWALVEWSKLPNPAGAICGEPMREIRRARDYPDRWCFRCRARRRFEYVVSAPVDLESWYGPHVHIECATCHKTDADLFPGRTRDWGDWDRTLDEAL